jgi:hypothetical protein
MPGTTRLFGEPVPRSASAAPAADPPAARWPRPLLAVAVVTALTALVVTVLALVDHTQVTGVDRWLKPWKFSVSIAVYVLTLSWMSRLVHRHRRTVLALAGIGAVAMVLELAVIVGQAARGRASHFNNQTPLDSALFGIMGMTIVLVWAVTFVLALVVLRERIAGPGLATGLHWGLAVLLVGMLEAALMVEPLNRWAEARAGGPPSVADGSHTIGALDGGPGLPVLGWSTVAGDLRIGHFIGLHALQLLPLLGWLLDRSARWTDRQRRRLVRIVGVGYLGVVVLLTWQALRGESLVHPGTLTLLFLAGLALAVGAAAAAVLRRSAPPPARGPAVVPEPRAAAEPSPDGAGPAHIPGAAVRRRYSAWTKS